MRANLSRWARSLAGALALLMGLTFAAPPAVAEEAKAPAPTTPQKASLAAATAATLAKLDTASAVTVTQEPAASSDSKPFFKTTKGVIVLALMIAGTAYTLYSKDKDRVKSPIR